MKTKLFALTFGYLAAAVVIWGCCREEYRIVGAADIFLGAADDPFVQVDTVREELTLIAEFETAKIGMAAGLISSCYATTCSYDYVNTVDEASVELAFDKAIQFAGTEIAANTNILDHAPIAALAEMSNNDYDSFYYFLLEFSDAFYQQVSIPEGPYTVTVRMKTTDDVLLESELAVYIEL